jgi:GNAT superfamily N-acetyltransferase
MYLDEQRASIDAACRELVAAGLLRPLAVQDPAERRLWRSMDLCSMVEGAFGERLDPRALSGDERRRWLDRLGEAYRTPALPAPYSTPFWLLHDGQPAGTLAVGTMTMGPELVPLTALYLLPVHRGAGLSARALRSLHEAAVRAGLGGLRLETYWVWQDAVRYYLRRGFWLFHWKHDLALMLHESLPDHRVEIAGDRAAFLVLLDGSFRPLYRAERHGEALRLFDEPIARSREHAYFAAIHGEATLSLALAVAGWPLIRSPEDWERSRYADTGPPEALAYRIEWYEALARHRGWRVETPRLPGLRYRSYAELHGEE